MTKLLALLFLFSCTSVTRYPTSVKSDGEETPPVVEENPCAHTPTAFNCVQVVEVYDGDTVFVDLPDQHPLFGSRMGVRIKGINAPEIRTKDPCEKEKGIEARDYLESLVKGAQRIDVVEAEKDKYFRILGHLVLDGKSVSEIMLEKKFVESYYGERREARDWCAGDETR
jgi:micrococcal nuclease